MSLVSLSMAAAAAFSAVYDCNVELPKALSESGAQVALNSIEFPGIPADAWRFRVAVKQGGEGLDVEVRWPENPIQIAGRFAGLVTADGSIAFTTFAQGPCLFTESMCMAMVHLVDQSARSASIIISPAALASDRAQNTREAFVVLIRGTCTRAETSK
jgi:hypothetical protein